VRGIPDGYAQDKNAQGLKKKYEKGFISFSGSFKLSFKK
jgi:hypothetical protein